MNTLNLVIIQAGFKISPVLLTKVSLFLKHLRILLRILSKIL